MVNKDQARSGVINATIIQLIAKTIKPGINGLDIERIINQELKKYHAQPAFLNYSGYKHSSCISVNETLVHGIPNTTPFKPGDVVSFDFGVTYNGWITDAAITLVIPPVPAKVTQLIQATSLALKKGIEMSVAGNRVGDISNAIESVANKYHLGVVKTLTGHGVGQELHQPPIIPNFGKPKTGEILKEGMSIAIEPMFSLNPDSPKKNTASTLTSQDGWNIDLKKGNIGAHFEHTLTITNHQPIILTAPVDTNGLIW